VLPYLAVPAVVLALSGCGSIYVGNVRFSADEICSKELASARNPDMGCMPPTRAENAQGFYLARFRLQVSPAEAESLLSGQPAAPSVNHLPSWIGRIFVARSGEQDSSAEVRWQAPPDGNIEFLPLSGAPEKKLATELQVKTDISGAVEKKLDASASFNPAEVVSSAMTAAGLVPAALPGLHGVLSEAVAKVGFERTSLDAGRGTYYYVSMKSAQLDSLTSALARCGWRVSQAPGSQRSTFPGAELFALMNKVASGLSDCLADGADSPIDPNVKMLLASVARERGARSDARVFGMVIGAAILRTEGRSELCSRQDLSLLASGTATSLSTSACEALRLLLNNFADKPGQTPAAPGQSQQAATLTPDQRKSLLMSLAFEYARSAYKAMQLYPHTSVLAIHWIPLQPKPLGAVSLPAPPTQ
jgi:hypothetical protein